MNKDWIKVFIAAYFEVFWVIGLKHANNFRAWTGTVFSEILFFNEPFKAEKIILILVLLVGDVGLN